MEVSQRRSIGLSRLVRSFVAEQISVGIHFPQKLGRINRSAETRNV